MLYYTQLQLSELLKDKKGGEEYVNNKVYVGNLPYTVTNDSLKAFFAAAGDITDAVVIMDRATNRSKGFGFVEFADDKAAQKAIEMFDGKDFEGRNIVVNIARPKAE